MPCLLLFEKIWTKRCALIEVKLRLQKFLFRQARRGVLLEWGSVPPVKGDPFYEEAANIIHVIAYNAEEPMDER